MQKVEEDSCQKIDAVRDVIAGGGGTGVVSANFSNEVCYAVEAHEPARLVEPGDAAACLDVLNNECIASVT
jgi:hypothetical protein